MALIIKLDDIMNAIKEKLTGRFDIVLGIERGGILPAYLASRWLNIPFTSMRISFRDDAHLPISAAPRLINGPLQETNGLHVLLVDDVCSTGATLNKASKELQAAEITTMVISGEADISLFGAHDRCIRWPWSR